MPRGYRSDTLAVGAGAIQVVVFNSNLLPQGGMSDLYLVATGANNSLDNAIDQIVVKLEGVEVINLTGAQIRVLLEGLRPSSTIPAAGQLTYSIPISWPKTMSGLWPIPAGVSGIPFGLNVSVEVTTTVASSAGTLQVGWTSLETPPSYMLKAVKQASGVGLNTVAPVSVNAGANDVVGMIFNNGATKVNKLRAVSRLADGREYQFMDLTPAMMIALMQDISPVTVTDPMLIVFEHPYKLGQNSYIEYTTGAGGLVSDLFTLLQVVDVRPATA
jgi:hypothetical protein